MPGSQALLASYGHTSLPTHNMAGGFRGQSSNIQGHTLSFEIRPTAATTAVTSRSQTPLFCAGPSSSFEERQAYSWKE